MRVHITGNAGAGKTTVSKVVGDLLNLPVFHLDEVVWRPHWKKAPLDVRAAREREWIAKPAWVIEGVSRQVRDAADIIVFLDVPIHTCAWRSIKRGISFMFRSRPEMPDHCPEIMMIPKVLRIIWNFPSLVRDPVFSELGSSPKLVVITQQEQIHAIFTRFNRESVT